MLSSKIRIIIKAERSTSFRAPMALESTSCSGKSSFTYSLPLFIATCWRLMLIYYLLGLPPTFHIFIPKSDLTIISDTHVNKQNKTRLRRPAGAFEWGAVLLPGCVNHIAGFRGNCRRVLVLLGRGRRSSTEQLSPCDVLCPGKHQVETRFFFFRLCHDLRRQPSLK